MTRAQVLELVERIGAALSAGDAKTLAGLWDLPALLLADQGARPVTAREEVEAFFERAIADYRSRGIFGTRGELNGFEPLSERLAWADITWPNLDEEGTAAGGERSFYLVRLGEDGQARIQVAMSRAA
jgi:hypothetical protein